jgi:hypothetical protein
MRLLRVTLTRHFLLGLSLAGGLVLPVRALEKGGMPDLAQEEQTCLPTSTANLIIWFGKHGYPKLILAGDTEQERELHTLHRLMTDTNARYDLGTRPDAITYGIEKYIHDAGYSCDVEYRGLDYGQAKFTQIVKDEEGALYHQKDAKPPQAFTQDWLQENDKPDKGFILLLAYCTFNRAQNSFSNAWNAGHAVTLVNAEPKMILVHDPAHDSDETGRKILTPEILTGGTFQSAGFEAPVAGLMLLSGSLLEAPPDAGVMLTGAVCITMHPDKQPGAIIASASGPPNTTIGGSEAVAPSAKPGSGSTQPATQETTWAMWLFDMVFKK